MADLLADIGAMLGTSSTGNIAKNSTSRPNNTELNMDDFLQLMIVQLTNQTIDDAMDTSEMMNQMLQMQMITAMSNMNDISIQSYANSLVGKLVTVGVLENNVLEERELYVYGTGTYNGQQVVFCSDGNMYFLNQIMAVGMLPNPDGTYGGTAGDLEDSGKIEVDPGEDGELGTADDWYHAEVGGEKKTVYVGEDKKAGTEDDWYYAEVDGEEKTVYAGADGKVGTEDDWYLDGEGNKVYAGADGVPGTSEDRPENSQSDE